MTKEREGGEVGYQEMYPFKPEYWVNKRKNTEERTEKRELLFFQMFYIFDDSRKKNKSTALSSFSFLMVGEAYEMRGSEMKTLKRMKDSINGNRQRESERETEIKGGSELHNQKKNNEQKGASHCWDPPPSHQFTPSNSVKWKIGLQTQWSTVLSTIKSEIQREILHLGSVCKVPLWALSSRLCSFYFWFAFLFFFFFIPLNFFFTPSVSERWIC